jgi:hypothetical protein
LSGLEQITERLRQIAVELADPEVGDERAAELSKEAAGLVAEASEQVNRALRESGGDE